ncbi:glucan endo-1 3-beta-glucosidase [Fusarium mundagurra]|uniref:Glucan endo-1 3-beta-glucosidase n=1 Tax=Fusarium mundagurra TaxID=1567541 RepID=A0A8H6DPZ7_9HYPO|nr:glucan endo-1 3-beta-glucosidase [Fusarium mundagurra]
MRPVTIVASLLCATCLTAAVRVVQRSSNHDTTPEGFLKVDPARLDKVEITPKNLLVGRSTNPRTQVLKDRTPNSPSLMLKLVNNFDREHTIRSYISGLDATGKVFFVSPDGKLIYPKSKEPRVPSEIMEDITLFLGPRSQPLEVPLPSFIRSGRIYFADSDLRFFVVSTGEGDSVIQPSVTNLHDPNADVNWGFVELSYMDDSLYANISYVDFVGIVLGMMLTEKGGSTQTTAGLVADAVTKICDDLAKQKEIDKRDWTSLCIANANGKAIRVLSPGNKHDLDPKLFDNYWDPYVNEVWKRYTAQDLTINTQTSSGHVKCRVSGNELLCEGSDHGFAKPVGKDIWGCNSGPFAISEDNTAVHAAIVPRICAAFVRSTLLLNGGNNQPSLGQKSYYRVSPTNHYSRIVHSYEVDGRGYAFPYDDVNPDGKEDASGVVSSNNAQSLTVYVGAPPPALARSH